MRKFMFAALAGVFMLSSGFEKDNNLLIEAKVETEDFSYNCACNKTVLVGYPVPVEVTFRTYVRDAAFCDYVSEGFGNFDSNDCQDSAGMLNAKSVESLQEAESGSGC
jgi:hypothetical protein